MFTEVKLKAQSQIEVVEIERDESKETSGENKPINLGKEFKGSNLSEIYGYTPYNITCSLEDLLKDKEKKMIKKRVMMGKNIEVDAKFYEMNKKKNC